MSWVRLSDDVHLNRKLLNVAPAIRWAWVAGIAYSRQQNLAGHLDPGTLRSHLAAQEAPRNAAAELIRVGLWIRSDDGGIDIHDYEGFNPPTSKERVAKHRMMHSGNAPRNAPRNGSVTLRDHKTDADETLPSRAGADALRTLGNLIDQVTPIPIPIPNPPTPHRGKDGRIETVWDAWRESTGHLEAKFSPKRERLIVKALSEYPLEDVLDAIRGWSKSPHHRGENPQGVIYNELTLLLRDPEKIEMFIGYQRGNGIAPPVAGMVNGKPDRRLVAANGNPTAAGWDAIGERLAERERSKSQLEIQAVNP